MKKYVFTGKTTKPVQGIFASYQSIPLPELYAVTQLVYSGTKPLLRYKISVSPEMVRIKRNNLGNPIYLNVPVVMF